MWKENDENRHSVTVTASVITVGQCVLRLVITLYCLHVLIYLLYLALCHALVMSSLLSLLVLTSTHPH